MEYLQYQLDNGLTLLSECNPQAYTAAFGFFVRTGSRDETPDIVGVSHFLEHMVFKGTPTRSGEQVNLALDEMGSSSNARTSEESTIYHASVLPEFQTPMVELLSDLMRPSLRDEDFQTEKQVIIEEIKMYADQPPYGGHEQIMAEFFGDHPLGQSVLGTETTISDLTREKMKEYFHERYSPSNMALCAAGNVDFERLKEDARQFCGDWEPFDAHRIEAPADYRFGFHTLHKPNSHQQYILQLAPGLGNDDPRRFALRVATAVIGDDSGSRMYWQFLDCGLAESAGMGSYEYHKNGLVMSYICCSPEQAQNNINLLHELQTRVYEQGITQKELDLAKRKIASHIVLSSERTESRMFSVGSQWLTRQPFKTVAEIAELYESLTLDEVNQTIGQYPLMKSTTLVVGPCQDLKAAVG